MKQVYKKCAPRLYLGQCYHVSARDSSLAELEAGPQGAGALPRVPLEDLLLNALQMLHNVASKPVLNSDENFNDLVEVERCHFERL